MGKITAICIDSAGGIGRVDKGTGRTYLSEQIAVLGASFRILITLS